MSLGKRGKAHGLAQCLCKLKACDAASNDGLTPASCCPIRKFVVHELSEPLDPTTVFCRYCFYDHIVSVRLMPLERMVRWTRELRSSLVSQGAASVHQVSS
jgi:hypothetical protein